MLGLTASQAGEALGIAEPTVREYRRRCRKKLGIDNLSDIEGVLPAGSLAKSPAEAAGSRAWPGAACCCLFAAAALVLVPIEGAVHAWSDVWATAFGLGIGLGGAWFVRAVLAGRGSGRIGLLAVVGGLVAATAILVCLRTGLVLPTEEGATRKALVLSGMALFVVCFALLFDRAVPHADPKVLSGAVLAAGMAVLCAQAGVVVWAVLLCLLMLGAAAFAVLAFWRGGDSDASALWLCPWSLPWLAGAALVAWTWSEVWRSQMYDSLLPILQWGALVVLAAASWKIYKACGVAARPTLVVALAVALLALCAVGFGEALALYALLLAAIWSQGRRGLRMEGRSWHTGAVAAACGAIGGTLVTNAVGYPLSRRAGLAAFGGPEAFMMLVTCCVGAVCLLVALSCVVAAVRAPASKLDNLPDEQRLEALFVDRGLSKAQANMVALLMTGVSAAEVAGRLHYAPSTVARARRDACRAFGVRTQGQLVDAVGKLL